MQTPILSFSEDSEIQIHIGLDEDYILSFEDDRSESYETLEDLYDELTRLDLRGILIPSSAFHDIEVLMQQENASGKREKYYAGYDFEMESEDDVLVDPEEVQRMLKSSLINKGESA